MNEMVEWMRGVIEGDKAAAEEAAKVYAPPWTLHEDPHGNYEPRNWEIHEAEYAFVKACGTCEHSGIDEAPGRHIARHDPRDTIARCEAELAILNRCEQAIKAEVGDIHPDARKLARFTIRRLVSGYQHRDGWKDEWRV